MSIKDQDPSKNQYSSYLEVGLTQYLGASDE